uniref:Uncharacterized protein n=1 Tax=Ralstonia solanacearum TaxID=305 RepID=A0A0S4TUT1_RALSL|nr:protein of unknown function [Ralstonia solanacearum]
MYKTMRSSAIATRSKKRCEEAFAVNANVLEKLQHARRYRGIRLVYLDEAGLAASPAVQ